VRCGKATLTEARPQSQDSVFKEKQIRTSTSSNYLRQLSRMGELLSCFYLIFKLHKYRLLKPMTINHQQPIFQRKRAASNIHSVLLRIPQGISSDAKGSSCYCDIPPASPFADLVSTPFQSQDNVPQMNMV